MERYGARANRIGEGGDVQQGVVVRDGAVRGLVGGSNRVEGRRSGRHMGTRDLFPVHVRNVAVIVIDPQPYALHLGEVGDGEVRARVDRPGVHRHRGLDHPSGSVAHPVGAVEEPRLAERSLGPGDSQDAARGEVVLHGAPQLDEHRLGSGKRGSRKRGEAPCREEEGREAGTAPWRDRGSVQGFLVHEKSTRPGKGLGYNATGSRRLRQVAGLVNV